MRNILIHRKKRILWGGDDLSGYNPNGVNWNNSTTLTQSYAPTKPADILSAEKKYNIKTNPNQNINNIDQTLGKDLNLQNNKPNSSDIAGKIGGYAQIAEAGIGGAINGANNWDKGKVQTQEGQFKFAQNQANDVSQTYSAGQTKLNTLSRTGAAASAKDLKTHKGWKNILGSTASGAMAGASVGGIWGAAIGGAVGLIGSSIGEILGKKKRKKEAEQLAEQKKAADYAIDYYNSKQAEQLASANDNAAKVQADQNRQSVLALAAYGGRLKRNYLLSKRNF